ncbi:MAG: hypothetical protein IKO61_03660 [Lachnospiraceae bacterium]|nr:hypothetical protein [Lachnospiraceae bacterium]
MVCNVCGGNQPDGREFCEFCGAKLAANATPTMAGGDGGWNGAQPGAQPGMQYGGQPGVQPGMQYGGQPGVQSGMQYGGQPGVQPGMQYGGQPGVQPGMQFGAQYGVNPGMQNSGKSGKKTGIIIAIIVVAVIAIAAAATLLCMKFFGKGGNDGKYVVESMMGMDVQSLLDLYAGMGGDSENVPKSAEDLMSLEIDGNKFTMSSKMDESMEMKGECKIDGEKIELTADGVTITGTIKDGKITIEEGGTTMVFKKK